MLKLSWKWSFLVESGMMIGPVLIMYLCISSRYYMTNEGANGDNVPPLAMAHSVDVRPMIMSNFSVKRGQQNNKTRMQSYISSAKHHVATHDVIGQSVLSSAFKKKGS